jgi:Big-like domain-containing protein
MGFWKLFVGRARVVLSTLVLGFVLGSSMPAAGAPAAGFPLLSSQTSPVTGAVTISAPAVLPEPGLAGVQFKMDGYAFGALDTTSPFQIVWSAASARDGDHTITAEVRLSSGVVVQSAPLLLTVTNPTTFNRVLHVDANVGNDANSGLQATAAVQTLAQVVSLAQAGDTVLLRGTFVGQDLIPTVSGTAAKPIIFTSTQGQPAVFKGGSVQLQGLQHIVLEGLAIVSGPIVLNGSNNNVIRDCQISNVGNGSGQWGHAIRMTNSSDNLVENCTITDIGNEAENTGDSIYIVTGAHRNRIINNTMQNGGHSLILVGSQQSTAMSYDNVIAGNTISNFYTTPLMLLYGSERTLVEANKISDGARNGVNYPRPGIQLVSSYNIIRYNEIFNNAAGALDIAAYVYGGTIPQDSIGNQIYSNVVYRNNLIQDTVNNSGALQLVESDGRAVRDNVIVNNIFFRNDGFAFGGQNYAITINHYGTSTAWPLGSLNGNRIRNNIVLRQPGAPGTPTVLRIRNGAQGGNVAYTLAAFQQTYTEASSNLETDPMFTDEASRVFTLRAGSPAIDRGMVMAGIPYLGAAPDVGAHEFAGGGPPADTTPPTVALVLPTAGQTVSGVVTITASASDNVGVTRIDYMQDGQVLGVLSPPAFTFSWNTAAVSNGAHTLTARAYDAAGNGTTSTGRSVTVANADTTKPTVTITTPTATPTYSTGTSSLTLGGTASDTVGVTQVTWANSRSGSGTATGTTSWTAGGIVLQSGANVLTVTARDAAGNTATDTVTVTYADTTVPTVTITTPTATPTYSTGTSSLTLGGTASDTVGVTQVTWANSRGSSGTATGTTSWTVGGIILQVGANVLTVTALDAAGNTATDTLTVTLTSTLPFTDDPLVAQSTLGRAVHIAELRAAINSARVARGLATVAWTDPTLTPGSTLIKVVHVTELRAALNAVYQAAGRTAPAYTDPTLVGGQTLIKAIHLNELRAAVLNIN